ncbi:MAG: hypothetical protein MZV64_04965 [Ignavibacteriales bacterium]|nr:hypothetical protein [Ignavibacteriales bacterium]
MMAASNRKTSVAATDVAAPTTSARRAERRARVLDRAPERVTGQSVRKLPGAVRRSASRRLSVTVPTASPRRMKSLDVSRCSISQVARPDRLVARDALEGAAPRSPRGPRP